MRRGSLGKFNECVAEGGTSRLLGGLPAPCVVEAGAPADSSVAAQPIAYRYNFSETRMFDLPLKDLADTGPYITFF